MHGAGATRFRSTVFFLRTCVVLRRGSACRGVRAPTVCLFAHTHTLFHRPPRSPWRSAQTAVTMSTTSTLEADALVRVAWVTDRSLKLQLLTTSPQGPSVTPSVAVDILLDRLALGDKYHTLRDVLRTSLGSVASPAAFVVAAVDNLSARAHADGSLSVPLFHMCLEALAGVEPWARPPYTGPSHSPRCEPSARAAVQLLAHAVMHPPARVIEPRAVLRLAQTFRLTHDDCDAMPGLPAACDAYALRLLQDGHHNAAVLLALQLRLPSVAHGGTLAVLLAANAESLAETLAGELGREAQTELVHLCLDDRRFKAAVRACRRFDLHATFPQAESLYTAATVSRLAAKGTWDVAAAIAQRSVPAQRQLIQAAVDCGEAAVAFELVERFNLAQEWDAAALSAAAEDAAASDLENYLQLGVDLHAQVHFVDSPQQLASVAAALRGAAALGLDAEWRSETVRPVGGRGGEDDGEGAKSRVALLQLATATQVFLLDLPALATQCPAALSQTLEAALGGALLLGVGVANDLAKCAADWPAVSAFASRAARPVDLRLAWRAARGEEAPPGGLAGAARVALGKPLDKRPRMSDWERRPLSDVQRRYAANDAHAALRIWQVLTEGMGEQQIEQLAQAVRGPQSPASRGARAPPATQPAGAGDLLPVLGTPAVEAAMLDSALPWRLVRTAQEGPTCASAALALGVPVLRIVKSLGLVLNDTTCVLLLLAGDQRADLHAVAATLGVQRRQLRFATADECVQLFGHAPGSMPPVGHRSRLRVIMDSELFSRAAPSDPLAMVDADLDGAAADEGVVYAGAGAMDMHLAMHVADMRSAAGAELAAIATRTTGGPTDPPPPGAATPAQNVAATPAAPVAETLAFVVDGALGRLGRWLRCLGVDVTCLAENESPLSLGADKLRGRVLLTRSRHVIAYMPASSVFYVGDGDPRDQLGRVRQRFGLAFRPERLLSRCAACNGVVEVRRSAEEVQLDPGVPEHVKRTISEFWACAQCGKTFWVGPKSRRAVELAASLCADTVYGHPLDGQPLYAPASDGLAEQIADVLRAFQPQDAAGGGFAFAR